MTILFYHPVFDFEYWSSLIKKYLPNETVIPYQEGKHSTIDYALIWHPKPKMLENQPNLKGIFILGAGVDSILGKKQKYPDLLPKNVPIFRLEDAGMVQQMQEYSTATVLRYFRRLDEYQQQQFNHNWQYLPPYQYSEFPIGIMGLGVLGAQVASHLANLGFTVKGWSRTRKRLDQVQCYTQNELNEFLSGTKVLINLLPSTPNTVGILNDKLFSQLTDNAYLINIARGKHLVEEDLLKAIKKKKIKAATLDVFHKEPLPNDHIFWNIKEITLTPHISAITIADLAVSQIVDKIKRIESGEVVTDGLVDLERGY